ncbi:hypothetical protein AMECASPLE_029452, partial [Ameca splendens]
PARTGKSTCHSFNINLPAAKCATGPDLITSSPSGSACRFQICCPSLWNFLHTLKRAASNNQSCYEGFFDFYLCL